MAKQVIQKVVPEHEKFHYKKPKDYHAIFARVRHRVVGHYVAYVLRKVGLSQLASRLHTIASLLTATRSGIWMNPIWRSTQMQMLTRSERQLLLDFAELQNEYGVDSSEVVTFLNKYEESPYLVELCNLSRNLRIRSGVGNVFLSRVEREREEKCSSQPE